VGGDYKLVAVDVSIGDLAKLAGLSVKTIRYYSEIGVGCIKYVELNSTSGRSGRKNSHKILNRPSNPSSTISS
jgi:hypothetical protein